MATILLVDDEIEIVRSLNRIISGAMGNTCEVLYTNIGWAAKEILQTQVVHVLLTDIRMPGLDGFALAKIAKKNNPGCRVIFLTGYQEFEYVYEAVKLGCDDFVLKVDSEDELIETVRETVKRVEREQQDRELIQRAEELYGRAGGHDAERENPISAVKKYMWEHVDQDISLNQLALYVYMNPSYLSRLFRQTTGATITEYLTDVRIKTAQKLLRESDLRVQEIARRIGVESAAYFGRMFKKATGCTPQEYRYRFGKNRNI